MGAIGSSLQKLRNYRLKKYLEAEEAVLKNQSYTVDGYTYTRANLSEIRKAVEEMIEEGATLEEGIEVVKRRTKRVVFKDG